VQQGNQTTPVKLTCEQCFTKFLSSTQIELLQRIFLALCPVLSRGGVGLVEFEGFLTGIEQGTGQSIDQAGCNNNHICSLSLHDHSRL
jgi:hypothetical protein